ncbi:MAG: hypothetical protein MPK11_07915 [Gammaproteobacteria bacterium]|nr:hypothetical protein [Gammaproteobacteria bacterium]MDA7962403.1 hypothetical protein [Gammaproteobacteria bacterium]MDA7970678.1 hypothetical protein [Gammaproteobacteria bacterium]MDA8030966.1 hypothetical protein [Alphaproteobacteria bacterium]
METATLEDRFVCAVRESYGEYNTHGARSSKKLRPLHQWVAEEIERELGAEYKTESLRKDSGREETIAGKYYDKVVDVSISKKGGAPLAIISIKFITSNFKQNANNYFEHLMGETANIRRAGVGFGHLMVLPEKIPYLKRGGQKDHTEEIGDAHLQKYVELSNDTDHPHRPDVIGIGIVSLHKSPDKIELADVRKMKLRAEIQSALANELSVPNFFQKMKLLTQTKA